MKMKPQLKTPGSPLLKGSPTLSNTNVARHMEDNPKASMPRSSSVSLQSGGNRANTPNTMTGTTAKGPGLDGDSARGYSKSNEALMMQHQPNVAKSTRPMHHTPTVHPLASPTAKPLSFHGMPGKADNDAPPEMY